MKLRSLIAAALLGAATLSTAAGFGDYEPVGFLSDYSRLQHKAGTEAYSWSEPAVQISAYDKVMVDRVKVYLKADAGRGEIDPATMQALAQHFHDAILKALGGSYQVTREPAMPLICAQALADDPPTLVTEGDPDRGIKPCAECHQPNGGGSEEVGAARLAAIGSQYIENQIRNFRNGNRNHPIMAPWAKELTDDGGRGPRRLLRRPAAGEQRHRAAAPEARGRPVARALRRLAQPPAALLPAVPRAARHRRRRELSGAGRAAVQLSGGADRAVGHRRSGRRSRRHDARRSRQAVHGRGAAGRRLLRLAPGAAGRRGRRRDRLRRAGAERCP
jgi:cytochrome c553